MEKQISKYYPEIKDCYIINEKSEVYNTVTGNKISHKKEKNGYIRVSLMRKEGGVKYISIHRLLMKAFNPIPNDENFQVNHKDGNKENNELSNLEWVTARENIQHAWKNNLSSSKNIEGEKTNFCRHSEKDAIKVIELLKTNNFTDKEINKITGLPVKSFIAKIRRKETWKYLTKDINTPLGKPERKTFSYK